MRKIHTAATIVGWSDGETTVPFVNSYPNVPRFVAKLQTRNEQDGGWPRYAALTATCP